MEEKGYKKYLNAAFLCIIFALTIRSVFHGEDIGLLIDSLRRARTDCVIASVLCVILYIIAESTIIEYLFRSLGTKVRFDRCCLYSFIGFFYSCITPSASGGQPMQVVAMRKDKIPVAVSTVVLAIVTITYKLVLVFIGVGVIVVHPEPVMSHLDGVQPLIYLGLILNVGCIALLFTLVFHPSVLRSCAQKTIQLIGRFRKFRHPGKLQDKVEATVNQYNGTAEYYRKHKGTIVVVFAITLAQRMLLFMVTWFAYRAFHLSGEHITVILLLQAMISVAVDMLPLPGGMGVSENLFLEIFLPIFGAELILPGMMISRGISYYTQLLLSAVMTIAASFIIRKRD